MNIVISFIRTNRYFRQASRRYWEEIYNSSWSDDECDDLDNLFAGCAFE